MKRKALPSAPLADLAPRLLRWFDRHGRHELPWQHPRTPYRVWLSEVMLQQTRVSVVLEYFQRFVAALPTLPDLARADLDQVLALWSGLGYYGRARNLHRAARECMERHDGELPRDLEGLAALPGIGRSTAGAILAQAHGQRVAILDGNVKRVLARLHGVRGWPGSSSTERMLWQLAESHLPGERLADYTQALMDFGATSCTRARPACGSCPLQAGCVAFRDGLVEQLPEARPARTLPVRQCVMLLVTDPQGRVLLQRRAATGVWAGLWSLPECVDQPAASDWLLRHLGGGASATPLPPFAHAFSHYRLEVTPLRAVRGAPATRVADAPDLRWAAHAELAGTGLPAPVRRLLDAALAPSPVPPGPVTA